MVSLPMVIGSRLFSHLLAGVALHVLLIARTSADDQTHVQLSVLTFNADSLRDLPVDIAQLQSASTLLAPRIARLVEATGRRV